MTVSTRGHTITAAVTLETEECPSCGITFAIPTDFRKACLDNRGKRFYCPSGHVMWYSGETEAEKTKRRADALSRRLESVQAQLTHEADQRKAAERSNRALRAVNTRTRNRIAAGVCPCCRRNFKDLAAHMAGQHPEYAREES